MACNCKKNVNVKTITKKQLIDNLQNKTTSGELNLPKPRELPKFVGTKIIY